MASPWGPFPGLGTVLRGGGAAKILSSGAPPTIGPQRMRDAAGFVAAGRWREPAFRVFDGPGMVRGVLEAWPAAGRLMVDLVADWPAAADMAGI